MTNRIHVVSEDTPKSCDITKLSIPVIIVAAAAFGKYLLCKHPETSKKIKDIFDSDSLASHITNAIITGKDE